MKFKGGGENMGVERPEMRRKKTKKEKNTHDIVDKGENP